jgi:CDP-diacylglycerol--serine O-phosphatidyltransferase
VGFFLFHPPFITLVRARSARYLDDISRMPAVKKIAIIPTLLTLGNAVCGFAAMVCASKIRLERLIDADPYFALAGWLIIGAMVFDALDGYVARLAKTASAFGMQLDSLCDAISFGVAPAFLLLRLGPGWSPAPRVHQALAVIAALYMVCTILRLARFNIEVQAEPGGSKKFRGLPSPGAAGCIASLAIFRGELTQRWPPLDPEVVRTVVEIWAILGGLLVALLMVSRLPYPHLTKQILRGRRPFRHLVQVVIAACVIILIRDLALVLLFWIYALAIPARQAWARVWHPKGDRPLAEGRLSPF